MRGIFFIAVMLSFQLFAQRLDYGIYVSNKYSSADVKNNTLYNMGILDPYTTVVEVNPEGMVFCFEDKDDCYSQELEYVGVHNGWDTYTSKDSKVFINYNVKGLSLMYNIVDNKYTKTVEFWNLKKYEEEKEVQ